ncbi:LysR family transcriptional regulator [Sandarakinorhabdus rubra]|uniref:LysR family transcriptional regulator n=1 Tax=Sandarakinorhabdus rubra TaxID=2672568 RepID=UPI0013DD78F5|nr:LysR family transcriptional regulator [Sandarakinorhabdus rubra]
MDRLHAMKILVRIAETGGFAETARQLGLSPPAVTRAIAALEDRVGARLLIRTTRSVKLTEAGQRLVEDSRRILAAVDEAEAAAAGSFGRPTGVLTVTSSVLFGQLYVVPLLCEFLDNFPEVTGRLLLLDRVTNLIDEGIDLAIRIGHLADSGLTATRVGQVSRMVCGSPDYFARHGEPLHPADLARHRIIAATSVSATQDWRFGTPQRPGVTVKPALHCNTIEAAIIAARAGWGLTRVLSYQIAPDLAAGRLQATLVDFEEEAMPIHIVHAQGRTAAAKVRAFADFAAMRLRANRLLNPASHA